MRKFTLLLTLLLAFMTTAIAQIDTSKEYRVKHTTTGKVMNASNYDAHPTGPLGGVNFVEEAESDDQVFLFEADGSGYKLKTKSGKYIYCQAWNVDALDQASTLTFSNNGDGTYKIGCDKGYFKVENVTGSPVVKENGAEVTKEQVSGYFPFCDAGYTAAANFELVEVEAGTPEVPATPLEVVSVSPSEAVNALSELTITFNQDVAGQFDQYAMVAMKLKKGTGVASGVSNYVVDGAVLTVTLSQEVTEAGEYTLVIPEGLITRKSDGAAYSGEHKFTVAEATPEVPAGPVVITDVAQLSNAKCYTLVSSDTGRGGMYALADKVDMCGVTYNAGTDACHSVALDNADPKQQFAFVEYEGKLYLYSVSEKKFVMKSGDTNALVGEAPFEHVVVEKVGENTFALQANGTHYFTASPGWCANPSRGTCIQSTLDSHSSDNGWDNGAWYTITEVADFDATEALAMLAPAPEVPEALELVSIEPADGAQITEFNTVTFTFNKPVKLVESEETGVLLMFNGGMAGQLWGEVPAEGSKTVVLSMGMPVNYEGTYTVYAMEGAFEDLDGNKSAEIMVNYTLAGAQDGFTYTYAAPTTDKVQQSLKKVTLGFASEVATVKTDAINVVDGEGNVVTTATLAADGFDSQAVAVTFAEEVVYTGTYSLTVPAQFITSTLGTYNPEFTLTYTVEGIEKPEVIGTPIKDVAELSNNYLYTVVQANHSKGATSWAVATGGAQFVSNADIDPTLEAGKADDARQQFAFISHEGTMYLYHAAEQKFVNKDCSLGEMPLDPIYFKAGAYANTFFAYFDESHYVNVGGSRQMIVDGWSTADGGNSCTITPVAEFDPTEVLKKFETPETPEVDEATLAAIEKAEGVLAKTGVGYPAAESASRTALVAAVEEAKAAATTENGTKVNAALATYLAETDVTLPETGKAYTFTMVAKNGNKFYLNYTGEDVAMVAATGEALPESAKFVATANGDGTYTFQTNDGNYLVYHSKYAGVSWLQVASTTGFQAEKDDMTNITLAKLSKGGNVAATDEQVFGLVSWYSKRGVRSDNGANEMGYMVLKADGSDYDGATAPFWNDNYSSAFLVEEAEVATPEVPALELASKYTGKFDIGGALVDGSLLIDQDVDGTAKAGYASLCFDLMGTPFSTSAPYELTETTLTMKGAVVGDGGMMGNNKEEDIIFTINEDGSLTSTQKIYGNTQQTAYFAILLSSDKFVPATETPATPLELVSVDPADGAELESVTKFTFTFNKPVTISEEGSVELQLNGGSIQLEGTVSETDAKVVIFSAEKEITNAGNYVLKVAAGTIVDADGNTNEEISLNYTVVSKNNTFAPVSTNPDVNEVQESLKTITLTFSDMVMDYDNKAKIKVTNEAGTEVTTATMDFDDAVWENMIVTLAEEIVAPGKYTITIPEESIFGYGVHNPEIVLTYTIEGEEPEVPYNTFVPTKITPAEGLVESLKEIVLDFGPNDYPGTNGLDMNSTFNLTNAAGDVVATGKLSYSGWTAAAVTLDKEVVEPSVYTIIIPEGSIWNSKVNGTADKGVSNGARCNPTLELTYEIKAATSVVAVDPACGHYEVMPATIKVTFSQEISAITFSRVRTDVKEEAYTLQATDMNINGKELTFTVPAEYVTEARNMLIMLSVVDANGNSVSYASNKETEIEGYVMLDYTADAITGINGITVEQLNDVYTLDGRKVVLTPGQKIKKGLYIVGGKKVYVK